MKVRSPTTTDSNPILQAKMREESCAAQPEHQYAKRNEPIASASLSAASAVQPFPCNPTPRELRHHTRRSELAHHAALVGSRHACGVAAPRTELAATAGNPAGAMFEIVKSRLAGGGRSRRPAHGYRRRWRLVYLRGKMARKARLTASTIFDDGSGSAGAGAGAGSSAIFAFGRMSSCFRCSP